MPESLESYTTLSHELSSRAVLPDDFPRHPFSTAFAGTETKLPARLIDGNYVVGLTPQEQFENHYVYLDFVNQIIAYAHGKRNQRPEVPFVEIVDEVVNQLSLQGWNLSKLGQEWIAKQLRQSFE